MSRTRDGQFGVLKDEEGFQTFMERRLGLADSTDLRLWPLGGNLGVGWAIRWNLFLAVHLR